MRMLLISMYFFISINSTLAQNVPIDFEDNGVGIDWNWKTFENSTNPDLEFVLNPDTTGINRSQKVAKFTALQTGQAFAGFESLHGAGIGSFIIDESNSIIRIMVWKSVLSEVGIKLVRADNWSLGEIKIPNTMVNQWEQIEFDFSDHIGNPYDQIVIFPDFSNRQADNVIYIDNVYGKLSSTTNTTELSKVEFHLSPNPASNFININSNNQVNSYAIYSTTGQLIEFKKPIKNNTINISHLQNGVFILKAKSADQLIIEKFIKI